MGLLILGISGKVLGGDPVVIYLKSRPNLLLS